MEIKDVFIDETNHTYIAMSMYNLIEYSDNYPDTSASLSQFKRYEFPDNNVDLTVDNSQINIFKTANAVNNTSSSVKSTKIVVPLKYLSNFWRSLEIPLINCKIHLELNWIEDCILSVAGDSAKFEIADAKLHVPIVTLSTTDNENLKKHLSNGFRSPVCWNSDQTIPSKVIEQRTNIYELLSASFQGVKILFVLVYVLNGNNNEAGIKNN